MHNNYLLLLLLLLNSRLHPRLAAPARALHARLTASSHARLHRPSRI